MTPPAAALTVQLSDSTGELEWLSKLSSIFLSSPNTSPLCEWSSAISRRSFIRLTPTAYRTGFRVFGSLFTTLSRAALIFRTPRAWPLNSYVCRYSSNVLIEMPFGRLLPRSTSFSAAPEPWGGVTRLEQVSPPNRLPPGTVLSGHTTYMAHQYARFPEPYAALVERRARPSQCAFHHAASRAGASSLAETKGRGTSAGQAASAGQCAENQAMMASYFRAVKDAPSFSRSKNRQSPVASRATVDASRSVAFANSRAQVSR